MFVKDKLNAPSAPSSHHQYMGAGKISLNLGTDAR
jgi:hypothetical protein